MKNYEATGKTYEEALENGLSAMGATISDVDITVLEEGSKGLFGLFGSRPYKVRLTMKAVEEDPLADLFRKEEPKPAPKPEKKPEPKAERKSAPKAEKPSAEELSAAKADQPTTEEMAAAKADAAEAKAELKPAPVQRKPKAPKAVKPAEVKAAEEAVNDESESDAGEVVEVKKSRSRNRRRGGKKNHGEHGAENGEEREDKPSQAARPLPPKEIKPIEKPVVTMIDADQVDPESPAGVAKAFLAELTGLMGVNVEIAVGNDEEGNVFVQMTGDTLGVLIGRRGETLDAIQYLTSLRVNRGKEGYTRVTIDTENYRAKREDTLIRLANRMANRAVKTGRKVSMEPMNPYERRIIHSALQA
ncbi:MAG: RNA-binding cell elongation regulator Jag/EloR, partial [Aristaeellaceae bacterium]